MGYTYLQATKKFQTIGSKWTEMPTYLRVYRKQLPIRI